jgi:Fe2+ transport system protein FeoA
MSVFELNKGEIGCIEQVDLQGSSYKRLLSLGFKRGAKVEILAFSLFRSSVLVGVGYTRVAIRRAVAEKILVTNFNSKILGK